MDTIEATDDSDTSSDDETEETAQELARVLCSHKATHQAVRFFGMTTTAVPHALSDCTVCFGVDPSKKVCSLVFRLSPQELVVIADGGCDAGLLGTDWYVLEYTG